MLSMVLEQNSISLPVEKRKYGIYIAVIKDKNIIKNSTFIFSVSADISTKKIKETLLSSLKLGTIETIKKLVNFHLVGFKIRALSTPPKEIPFKVDMVDIFRKPDVIGHVVDAAIKRGDVDTIWTQLGLVNNEAAQKAEKSGMKVVQNKCTKIEHRAIFG